MTREELSKITWMFNGVLYYGCEVVQILVVPEYGFENKVHKVTKPDGETEIWGEYIYKGKSYKTWDEFAEAVKDVKFIPELVDDELDDDEDEWDDDDW